jgi:hypothetical protein
MISFCRLLVGILAVCGSGFSQAGLLLIPGPRARLRAEGDIPGR